VQFLGTCAAKSVRLGTFDRENEYMNRKRNTNQLDIHVMCDVFLLACSFNSPVQSIRSLGLHHLQLTNSVHSSPAVSQGMCAKTLSYSPEREESSKQSKDNGTQLSRGIDESSGFQISFASKVGRSTSLLSWNLACENPDSC
jgi:hypothetical protein